MRAPGAPAILGFAMKTPRLVLVLVVSAAPSIGQVIPGQQAPEVKIDKLFHSPVPFEKLKDLQGSAVLLEFWATWCGPCRAQIPHMVETHNKYADRGLVVLAMTNEAADKVEPFIEQNGMVYRIGIDAGGAAAKAYGVSGIPHAFLIDKDGKIVWGDHPSNLKESDLEKALEGATPPGGKLTGQLEPVQMLLDKGQAGCALATLVTLQQSGKLPAEAKEQAAKAQARLEREAKAALAHVQDLLTKGSAFQAVLAFQEIATRFEGSEHGSAAQAALERIGKDETGKRAVDAAARIQKARQLTAGKRYDDAYAEYRPLAEDADVAVRDVVAKEMDAINRTGLRGYHADCMLCRVLGKACKDHQPK
jgi:peroxiredoxin